MATNHTENYQLNLWEPGDSFLRTEFNENTQKIDTALALKGNCKLVSGTYTGTGEYGEEHPNSLTFPGQPLLVFVNSFYSHVWMIQGQTRAIAVYNTNSGIEMPFKWTGNKVEWYSPHNAKAHLNEKNYTYWYVALIAL